jgi:CRISPR/Cas system Type II protein with McrA/HNH and RuvC-like nuclease domain
MKEFKMTAMDIKKIWFEKNNNYNNPYIHKVLKNDMKVPIGKNQRYYPLEGESSKIGTPYIFKRENFVKDEMEIEVNFAPESVNGLPF